MLGKTCSNLYQTHICYFYYISHAGLWRIKEELISSQLHTYSRHICRQKENVTAESNSSKKARLQISNVVALCLQLVQISLHGTIRQR